MKFISFTRTAIASAVAISAFMSSAHAQAIPTEMMANDVAFKQMNVYGAWAQGYTGKGVRIGFVDTGADLNNPDMKNIILAKSPYYKTMVDVDRGHGTGVISLAAGTKDGTGVVGVAPDSNVLVYAGGIGGFMLYSDISNGIKWNADNKADIINLSLGARMNASDFSAYYKTIAPGVYARTKSSDPYNNNTLLPALQYAVAKNPNTVLVFAAGNDSNLVPTSPSNLAVKTDANGNLLLGGQALIVGAVDKNNVIASFSNRAGHICQNLVANVCQDKVLIRDFFVVAPGGSLVWVANSGGTKIVQDIGSSDSTAFLSGVVSLVKGANPTLSGRQLVDVIRFTATYLPTPGGAYIAGGTNDITGHGLVDANAAVSMALGKTSLVKATTQSSTSVVAGNTNLTTSGMSGGIITKQSFMSSTALQNARVVDETGRTFTANMTNGIGTMMQSYSPATAYSALSQTTVNYVDLGYANALSSVFSSPNMNGAKVGHQFSNKIYMGVEVGAAHEYGSVLGTHGAGAFAVGNADTNWSGVHMAVPVANESMMFGSVSAGTTRAGVAQDSLITGFSTLKTKTWTLGFQRHNVFANKDTLSFQVTEMPHITAGTAQITATTDINYSNVTDEGAIATPTVTKESVNLATAYRQYASSATYMMPLSKNAIFKASFTLQTDNAGTKAGQFLMMNVTQRF